MAPNGLASPIGTADPAKSDFRQLQAVVAGNVVFRELERSETANGIGAVLFFLALPPADRAAPLGIQR